MSTSKRIAVIAGDGIGKEVIPAGVAALEAATRGSGLSLSFTELPWGCEFYTQHERMMDEDGFRPALATFDAIYLGAIGAPGVPDPRVRGLILRDPSAVRSVRQPAADAPAAGAELAAREPRRGRHRHGVRARELRRRVLRRRRADSSRHAARGRAAGRRLHAARHRAHPALRLRARGEAAAEDARERDEVQRAHALDGDVGRGRRDRAKGLPDGRVPEVSRRRARRAHGHASADARRHGGVEPLRRHPHRHRIGDLGQPRHRAGREHQSRTRRTRRCSSRSTARRPTSRAKASPTRSAPSGPAR